MPTWGGHCMLQLGLPVESKRESDPCNPFSCSITVRVRARVKVSGREAKCNYINREGIRLVFLRILGGLLTLTLVSMGSWNCAVYILTCCRRDPCSVTAGGRRNSVWRLDCRGKQ